jgi:hypothetical protein
MSRKKQHKHIDEIRKEVVEILSTTSNPVAITRAWEVVTGNTAFHTLNDNSEMIEVLLLKSDG